MTNHTIMLLEIAKPYSRDEKQFNNWAEKKGFNVCFCSAPVFDGEFLYHLYLVRINSDHEIAISFYKNGNIICTHEPINHAEKYNDREIYSGNSWFQCHKILERKIEEFKK